jgi:hypothetical protein
MAGYISKIFGASPVGPMQDHMDTCYSCAKELTTFFEHVVSGNWDQVESSRNRIVELEHAADEFKRQVRSQLPKSLLMPVPREDLMELMQVQDEIANRARDVSGLVLGRRMELPAPIQKEFLSFVSRNVDAAKKARKSIRELDELYESGFRGAEAKLVESLVHEMDKIEDDTDVMQVEIRAKLFLIEDTLPPVNVIFLYRIIELTGDIADVADRIGRRIQVLLSH